MADWILEKASDGDLAGGIRADQVVAWEVTQWPPAESDDVYVEVGFWLQGDYRMVEPGQAPMHLNLTLDEYHAAVTMLRFGAPNASGDGASSPPVTRSAPRRGPARKPAKKVEPVAVEPEVTADDDGDDSETEDNPE